MSLFCPFSGAAQAGMSVSAQGGAKQKRVPFSRPGLAGTMAMTTGGRMLPACGGLLDARLADRPPRGGRTYAQLRQGPAFRRLRCPAQQPCPVRYTEDPDPEIPKKKTKGWGNMSKTRMGKRVASLLLSLVMMLSLLPTTVYATGDTGETKNEIVGQATTSGDNTEGTGEPEPTGEGEDGSANVTEGEDGAATNDAVVEETIAPVNAEGVDAVANAESSGDEVSGEDGTVKKDETSTAVAKIGDKEYATLQAAIDAATAGDIVTLLADVNLTSAQTISKQLTIDLNGKTISSTAYRTIQLKAGADLTVKDSASGGKITNTYTGSAYPATIYLNDARTKFTLESGTIESDPNVTSLQSVAINSEKNRACEVNIRGGSVTVPEAATEGRAIVASTNSMTLNISGGTITGGLHGVDAYGGSTVNITGGEITARVVDTGVIKEAYGMRIIGTADVTVAGGTITGVKMDDNGYQGDVPAVKLKSGTIKGSFYSVSKGTIIFDVAENADIVLENNSAAQFLPDTVKLVQNADGTYGVKKGSYVAQIGDVKYETLKDAINAANTGNTIVLLADVDLGSSKIGFYKTGCENLTFDLNGHKITSAIQNNGTVVASKVGLVIKNGTIENTCTDTKAKDATSAVYVVNGGTTTLENVTLHSNYSGLYVCQLSNAVTVVVNVEKDTVISGGKYGVNLDAPKGTATTAPGVTLNVNGGTITGTTDGIYANSPGSGKYGTINANITAGTVGGVRVVSNNTKQPVKLDITGGTINGELYNLGSTVTISGGTFAIKPDTTYLAKGYTITENADNTYGVKKTTYVAEVNGTQYESLQAAIDAAARKATVTMLADTRENVTISTPYLTLDLNGFTLNGSTGERKPALTITARVTVMDSSEAKTGTIMREDTAENSGVSSHYVIDIQGAGWLTFESGNVKNDSGAGGTKGASLVRVGDDSVAKYPGLNIKGGTFTQDNFIVIKVDSGDLFLNGGTLNSTDSYAIENWHRATIKGGTVNGTVAAWTYSGGHNSDLSIEGGTVNGNVESVSYDGAEGKLAKVKITGGTVNGTLSTHIYNKETEPSKDIATIEVTSGTFKEDPTKYLVECSAVTQNADGTYGVAKAYLARIGETFYYTMEDAFQAQTNGDTIVLLRDYTTGGTFNSGSINRTVDLNGHTWTCTGTDANSAAFEINYPNASLTVKNGKIVSSQLVGLIPSASGGTITYDNSSLTFENVEMSTTATSGIETNGNNTNDTVTLKDSTLNVPNGFGIYFPSSGTLTIDNSTINAKTMGVQVCSGSLSINAGSAITVTGDAVSKTENDGAIQDGAAISIVNRAGYKGLGDVTVTGGTFTAKTGNAAIKAYDWDNTNKVEKTFTANDKVFVSGGTFSSAVPEGLCAEGYIPTKNEGGTHTVKKGTYVAEYNGTKYETLQKAIDAASQKNGGQTEVKLLCNLTITETVNFAKEYSAGSVLLNLGGYTLTGEGCRALQINKGSLYLENGTVTSTGIIDSSSVIRIGSNEETYNGATPMLYMQKDAKVVAPESYGVTIFGSATRGEKLKVMSNAEIIATGPSPAISGNGGANYNTDDRTSGWKAEEIIIGENAVISAANNYAIYHPECGTLNIQGGTITGTGGIQMCSGTLKISNSPKITANGSADYDYTGDAGVVYDAAAISVINRGYPQGPATVTIKGTPTVTAANGEVIHAFTWSNSNKTDGEWAEAGDYINVSGGTYNKQFNEAYLAADCTLVTNSEGGYTVEQKKVAEYNGIQYTSLSQAIRDANNSGAKATVKLLDNVTLTNSLGIGGTAAVTLDLNKKTLTLNGAQIYTQGSAAVIINNGTIERIDAPTSGSPNDFAIQVMSGSSLTLGATSAATVTIKSTYGVYNAGGTLTVGHATITTDGWSVAVNDSASKTGVVTIGEGAIISSQNGNCIGTMVGSKPNVTITGGQLTSNGTAWDAGVIYWASEGTLTITGGTFTASSAEGSTAAAVYQKNGTVKISGTTAKLLGNNALVVKSGEGSTGTMITELSGGTYSTRPEDSWVVNGYRAIENTDGTYTVAEGEFTVQVTSRTVSSESPVAHVSGGGNITYAEGTIATTTTVAGYEFVGWYVDNYPDGKYLGKELTITYKPTADCTLVAVYKPISGGTFELKVDASKFKVNGGATNTSKFSAKLTANSLVTIKFTGDNFLYWVNGSGKVVSTLTEYTFTLVSATVLSAVYTNSEADEAQVIFLTANPGDPNSAPQIVSSRAYAKDTTTISFPAPPVRIGKSFTGWSMTQEQIIAAIPDANVERGGKILVYAMYEDQKLLCTVTVFYGDRQQEITATIGTRVELTAPQQADGKEFSCWKDSEGKVLGTTRNLYVTPVGDMTVYAVYGETVEQLPTISMLKPVASVANEKYVVTFSAVRSIPDGYTIEELGILYSMDRSYGNSDAKEYMVLGSDGEVPAGVYRARATQTTPLGTVRCNITTGSADRTFYARGYMILKDSEGNIAPYYSEIASGSYNSLTNGGN